MECEVGHAVLVCDPDLGRSAGFKARPLLSASICPDREASDETRMVLGIGASAGQRPAETLRKHQRADGRRDRLILKRNIARDQHVRGGSFGSFLSLIWIRCISRRPVDSPT
jgi:hypothetical protein